MIASRIKAWAGRAKEAIRRSFAEEHSPRETAGSFALGVFITMLPTLGVGLGVFVVLAWLFDRINKLALFASVVVFNPVVKWGVYAASFTLGVLILGPVDGVGTAQVSLTAGPEILVRLLVGNLILAVVAAVPSYVICLRLVESYQAPDVVETLEGVIGPIGGDSTAADDERGDHDESADATGD